MAAKIKRLLTLILIFLGPGAIIYWLATTLDNHFIELPYLGYTYTYGEDGDVIDSTAYCIPNFDLKTFDGEVINRDSIRGKFIVLTTLQNECPEFDSCALGVYHFNILFFKKLVKNQRSYGNVKVLSILTDHDGKEVSEGPCEKLLEEMEEYNSDIWWMCRGDPKPFYDFQYYGDNFMNHKSSPTNGEIGPYAFINSLVLIDDKGYIRGVTGAKKDSDIRNFFDMLKLLKKEEFDRNRKKNARKK
ncbi:hypothetical protein JYT74_02950 [Crocinitomix catalasitica]|nr:hypothetical protein [Crocinitomix catalasitica]